MKILVLSSLARDSGCYLRARHLAQALRACGHTVELPTPPSSLPCFLDLPLSFLRYLPVILKFRYDVAVVIKPYPSTLWPLLFKRRCLGGGRVVVDVDDVDYGYRGGWASALLRRIQRPLPIRCDLVTCHNDWLQQFVATEYRVPADRIYRLGQGVDLNIYRPLAGAAGAERRAALRQQYGLGEFPTLIYVGHLNIASDLDVILEAVATVLRRQPDVRFVVAGGGPMQAHFRRLAAALPDGARVIFTGQQTPEEINDWLQAADVALVYYKEREVNRHRVSMKVRECLAAGIPLVCNDFGDLAQFRPVTFQSATSAAAFAGEILRVLHAPPPRAALAVQGRALIREHFDWAVIGRAFAERLGQWTDLRAECRA
ncbi:MAG: glycosyltransferase family 4 protein [Kiritimatiellaeota bacterium]|nr:glycosyltransferase family 4 protein [Kiritimatiellota bacterium]